MPIGLLLLVLAGAVLLWLGWRKAAPAPEAVPHRAITVDGSNVMFWGGEPSAKVLSQVLKAVKAKGLTPIVFFDANVGYKLSGRYMDAKDLAPLIGVSPDQIHVVDKGVVADQAILAYSAANALKVISNDRYRAWRGQYPHAGKKGRMVRGEYSNGSVIWRDKGSFR